MQRRRRAVIADIRHDLAGARQFIDAGAIGALVDETALGQSVQEVGTEIGHDGVREPSYCPAPRRSPPKNPAVGAIFRRMASAGVTFRQDHA